MGDLVRCVAGFEDSVRKFVCHVISITYQNILDETLCEQLGLVDENAVNQGGNSIEKNTSSFSLKNGLSFLTLCRTRSGPKIPAAGHLDGVIF